MRYETDAEWVHRAACRGMDPDLFFPAQGENLTSPRAVCRACPVRTECLEYAMAVPELFGIWGGLSDRERRRLRRRSSVMERNDGTMAS